MLQQRNNVPDIGPNGMRRQATLQRQMPLKVVDHPPKRSRQPHSRAKQAGPHRLRIRHKRTHCAAHKTWSSIATQGQRHGISQANARYNPNVPIHPAEQAHSQVAGSDVMKRSSPHPREVRRRAVRPVIEHRESLWSRHGSARFADKFGMPPRRTAAGRHRPKVDIGWRLAAGGWRLAAGGWRLAKCPPNSSGCGGTTPSCGAPTTSRSPATSFLAVESDRPRTNEIEDSGAAGGLHHPECLMGQVKQVQ
jgi:hypothetical protein